MKLYTHNWIDPVIVVATIVCSATWSTHVVMSIKTAQWLLLITGITIFPVGIIHGIGIWFGFWN